MVFKREKRKEISFFSMKTFCKGHFPRTRIESITNNGQWAYRGPKIDLMC